MFEIRRKEQLTSNIYLMEISAYWVARAAKPGQFIIIIIDDKGERIPFSEKEIAINAAKELILAKESIVLA